MVAELPLGEDHCRIGVDWKGKPDIEIHVTEPVVVGPVVHLLPLLLQQHHHLLPHPILHPKLVNNLLGFMIDTVLNNRFYIVKILGKGVR